MSTGGGGGVVFERDAAAVISKTPIGSYAEVRFHVYERDACVVTPCDHRFVGGRRFLRADCSNDACRVELDSEVHGSAGWVRVTPLRSGPARVHVVVGGDDGEEWDGYTDVTLPALGRVDVDFGHDAMVDQTPILASTALTAYFAAWGADGTQHNVFTPEAFRLEVEGSALDRLGDRTLPYAQLFARRAGTSRLRIVADQTEATRDLEIVATEDVADVELRSMDLRPEASMASLDRIRRLHLAFDVEDGYQKVALPVARLRDGRLALGTVDAWVEPPEIAQLTIGGTLLGIHAMSAGSGMLFVRVHDAIAMVPVVVDADASRVARSSRIEEEGLPFLPELGERPEPGAGYLLR